MSKKTTAKRKRNKTKQAAAVADMQVKSGPPQFFLDTVDAVNSQRYDKAIDILKANIEQDSFTAYKGIGDIHLLRGENEEAMVWLEKARQCNPDSLELVESIGQALVRLGREDEAVEIFCDAIKRQKKMEHVRFLLNAMYELKLTKGLETLAKAIETDSSRPDIMFEFALLFEKIGQLVIAEEWCKKIMKILPVWEVYNLLGVICLHDGRIAEAAQNFQKAMELAPDEVMIWNNLSRAMMQLGDTQGSFELLRKSIDKMPDNSEIHSTFLFRMHYIPDLDLKTIFEEHKRWGQKHAPISMARTHHDNTPEPDRKLRIGYISPDFRDHVVAIHFEPLLDSHNRDVVEVYGYGNVQKSDPIEMRLREKFDRYRNIWDASDDAVAHTIEQDKIDILIDLAGHSLNNRLLVLARKPAPVQVTYLGYYDTTGVEAIDYLLTDRLTCPPESQKYYTEKLAYLSGRILSYTSPVETEDVSPLPAIEKGHVTFGIFTNDRRFNKSLFKTLSEILKLTTNSRLLLGFRGGDDEKVRANFLSQFEKHGVAKERIEISGRKSYKEYLKQYNNIDIAFDTFPENGGTTTCDALWMGVPVISLAGEHMNCRVGISILGSIGLDSLVAATQTEYIEKAVELAKDTEKLKTIRSSMRSRLAEHSFCDTKRLARDMEVAYRKMWYQWCQKQGVSVPTRAI
jgi:predicted O-linked N-acetylglucosamine transferase (SPINDLY family)